jgi:ribonuclease HII
VLEFENEVWNEGYELIGGIDEAGRGPLCGSVVAACVIMPKNLLIEGVNDSKKLSAKKREKLYDIIFEKAVSIGIGIVDEKIIDEINIKQAARLAMKHAVENMAVKPEYLLIDAENVDMDIPQQSIIKGDQKSHSIAAASIIAKVTRDRMCIEWDKEYPKYNILKHKGYGTKEHIEAIKKYGPCSLHRKTFIKNFVK